MGRVPRPDRAVARRARLLLGREHGNRGAIAVFGSIVLVAVLLPTAALSMDTMGRTEVSRQNQGAADLAALDATYAYAGGATQSAATLACDSVQRNIAGASCSDVTTTVSSTGSGPTTYDVTVTVATPYSNVFAVGNSTIAKTAVAQVVATASTSAGTSSTAQFSVGSTLVEVNAGLGRFGSISLSAVGYQGLVSGTTTLSALNTKLGLNALTANALLTDQVTVGQMLTAESSLLGSNGDTSAQGTLNTLIATLTTSFSSTLNAQFTVGDLLGISSGNGSTLSTEVSFLQMVNGTLQVANGQAGISLNLGVTGVGSANVALIVPPKVSPDGPVGVTATNTQVTVGASGPSVSVVGVSVPLTLSITAGGSTGTLDAIDGCGTTPTDIAIGTAFNDATVAFSGSVSVLGVVTSVSGVIYVPGNPPSPNPTTVPDAADFVPNAGTAPAASSGLGTTSISLTATSAGVALSGSVLTSLGSTITSLLSPTTLISNMLSGLTGGPASFGIDIGNANYQGLNAACGNPSTSTTTLSNERLIG